MSIVRCVDCLAEGITTVRPTNVEQHPRSPRCATHQRAHDKAARASRRRSATVRLYGLRPGDFDALYRAQKGKCAICGWLTGRRATCVDHCHRTGEVRGLLCQVCNKVIGFYRDNFLIFRCFVEYLTKPPARAVLGERDWSDRAEV